MKKHHHKRPEHTTKSRKLHEHEYHSPAQLLFNRIFVAPAVNANPVNPNDPDNDGDNDSGNPDND